MRLDFLTREHSDRLILIVAGWGSDCHAYSHIQVPGWDVAVIWGIDEEMPELAALRDYQTVYLYAWSLGVWIADRILGGVLTPVKAYAVNGTPWPCSDTKGIPEQVFRQTEATLNTRNLHKFRVRMCGGLSAYKEVESRFAHIQDVEKLRGELRNVLSVSSASEAASIRWDVAFVGSDDMIFPAENQQRAWHSIADVRVQQAPHYMDLLPIVRQTAVNVSHVGRHFSRSLDTYEAHAHAQRLIAETLARKTFESVACVPTQGDVVEIGCGTGMYTRCWSKYFRAHRALYVDLCEMPRYGVALQESYTQRDAERVMGELAEEQPDMYAALFSASAIQWLSNLPLFFANCAKVLHRDGVLSMSTFAPGNLHELTGLRPDHLQYMAAGQLRELLSEYFDWVNVEEESIELEFSTPLEALRHLQLTGVTASGSRRATVSELREFAQRFPMNGRGRYTLTFRPIYIVAGTPRR